MITIYHCTTPEEGLMEEAVALNVNKFGKLCSFLCSPNIKRAISLAIK